MKALNREIKFRAWDKEDKLWIAGWSIGQMGIQSDNGTINISTIHRTPR